MARKNSTDDIQNLHDYGIYVPTRTIQFPITDGDCDISQASVNQVISNLHILETLDSVKPITFILNSYGGDVYQALGLYDYIRSMTCEVHIQAIGACMSGATLILQAGDKRIISENCTFMMHVGSEGYAEDHAYTVRRWVKHSEQVIEPKMKSIYLSKLKRKAKETDLQLERRVERLLALDTILTAEQVIELGLADELLPVKYKA